MRSLKRRATPRAAIGVVVVALTLGLLGPPAAADTLVVPDRAGDGQGLGDVRALRLSQAGERVLAQVRTARGVDIDSAPTWTTPGSSTLLRFNFDTNADGLIDWAVLVEPGASGAHATLMGIAQSPAPRLPVACVILSQPEPTVIRIKVLMGCIGLPEHVRAFSRYWFDAGGNGSVDSIDRAPNAGYTGSLPLSN